MQIKPKHMEFLLSRKSSPEIYNYKAQAWEDVDIKQLAASNPLAVMDYLDQTPAMQSLYMVYLAAKVPPEEAYLACMWTLVGNDEKADAIVNPYINGGDLS